MKKLFALLTVILTVAVTTACATGATVSVFGGSYFLSDPAILEVGEMDETAYYDLSFNSNDTEGLKFSLSDGSQYKTRVYTSEYNGQRCYCQETTLNVNGRYQIGETSTDVADTITTKAYFLGVKNQLKTLHSERNASVHGVTTENGAYKLNEYAYTVSTDYDDKNATVTFQKTKGEFNLAEGQTTYSDVFKKTYLDNEILLFAIRSFKLSDSFSASFDSIDALAKLKRTLSVASPASSNASNVITKETIKLDDYTNDSEKISSVETFVLNMNVSGTYTGSVIKLNYATSDSAKEGQRLIRMQTSLMHDRGSYGTLTYTIKKVEKA